MTPLGWLMTVMMTYVGFTLLMIAAFWNANILDKCKDIRRQWRMLRGKE